MTPTARSLKYLRAAGWTADVVERRLPIPGQHVTRDCFGAGDILACHPALKQVALYQVTSKANVAARIAKVTVLPTVLAWLRSGGLFWVHGWAKSGGGKWTLRAVQIVAEGVDPRTIEHKPRRVRRARQKGLFE